jgi:hypothetical protein
VALARVSPLRDAERELTPDAIQRITTENTTLKQRVRQPTADNRARQERLEAARSSNRFAERRIAQLEAQLIERGGDRGEPVGKMQPVPGAGEEAAGPVR